VLQIKAQPLPLWLLAFNSGGPFWRMSHKSKEIKFMFAAGPAYAGATPAALPARRTS
jgi:hypothetical protein